MSEFRDQLMGMRARRRKYGIRRFTLVVVPILAILFQVYAPQFITYLSFLELPLLVTVYFALTRREPIAGILTGCAIGLAQDSFSHNPLGVFGIVKTLVGYFAATLSQRLDAENALARFFIALFFYFFHQVTAWALVATLLAQPLPFNLLETLVFGLLNAAVAVPLFSLLDRL